MSSVNHATDSPSLDLSKWRPVPNILIGVGALLAVVGVIYDPRLFAFSWLQAYMFFLSFGLGGWFLTMLHHLVDASWSVPIRRINEHLGCLLKWMALFFIPIALFATKIYPWMTLDPATNHELHLKLPLFSQVGFYVVALFNFAVWWYFPAKLREASLRQDQTGAAECTFKMRKLSYVGIFLFAVSLTLGAMMWVKALTFQWFSTMYGVYYFADSVWVTLATVYLIASILKRTGSLDGVMSENHFYLLGSLWFAFTVFYGYVHFMQYFIIWNANMPEETFWYVLREKGAWWSIGMVIVFGHFFVPFLGLLRIDVKNWLWWMAPLAVWAWLMRFCDESYNVMPALRPNGFELHWLDLGCLALIGGCLAKLFLKDLNSHPIYPQKDPRMAETLGVYVAPLSEKRPVAARGGAK